MENSNAQIQQALNRALPASAAARSTPAKTVSATPRATPSCDRFIPNRESCNTDAALLALEDADSDSDFSSQLSKSLFDGDALNSKILAFKHKAKPCTQSFEANMRAVYSANDMDMASAPKRVNRYIPTSAERILDAPELIDDYYLNLLDWSSQNKVAIALGASVYLWDAVNQSIDVLFEGSEESPVAVTSVAWMADGSHIAIGTDNNDVQLWNVERKKQVRCMTGHSARVGALSWNSHVLSSGSRDGLIFHHDVRVAQHHFRTLTGHTQEVCGLKWSPDGTQLASGSNDNTCMIWDASSTGSARFTFTESVAAVKALAWCPWQKNVLATGSGTADRHIRFYNTQSGSLINKIDTQSQVCSLVWSTTEKELLSSHGFSQNQLSVWKFPSLVKVADLTGHSARVLHTAISPDGTTVCSAAADETMRFWKVWESAAQKQARRAQETAVSGTSSKMLALR